MRTFVFKDDKSDKFWNIELRGQRFTVAFGRVGSKGQTQAKEFPDAAAARKAHDKLVAEKLGKGYVETTPAAAPKPAPSPLRLSLEAALVENPDDLASHSAYADYLMEQGDPRGEFIQAQLALEDESRPAAERKKLRAREAELLALHAKEWLGDAGRFLVGDWSGPDKPWRWSFRRGWLDSVRLMPSPDAVIASLARSPEARLLSRLEIVYDMRYHPFDFDQWEQGPKEALAEGEGDSELYEECTILPPLLASPHLGNLRAFKVGFSDDDPAHIRHSTMLGTFRDCTAAQILELLGKCPRMEELYLNTDLAGIDTLFASPRLAGLRVLQYYFGTDYNLYDSPLKAGYPLAALAGNAALADLRELRLHPGRDATLDIKGVQALLASTNLPALQRLQMQMTDYGDEGAAAIVKSGIMAHLKSLDIGHGNMTDEGARLLADDAGIRALETLDVSRNALTPAGIRALRAVCANVVAERQHLTGGEDDDEYLYEVDVE